MLIKDVTNKVCFGLNDDEYLPLTKCVCDEKFPLWEFILSIYKDDIRACTACGRKLFFETSIKVYELIKE